MVRILYRDEQVVVADKPPGILTVPGRGDASEALIARALERIRVGRTCLAITHRLTLFDRADVVYHLEDGKIVEQTSGLRLVSPAGGHPA